jgi:hypothetical protein
MRRLDVARFIKVMGRRSPAWVKELLMYQPLTEYVTEPAMLRKHVSGGFAPSE